MQQHAVLHGAQGIRVFDVFHGNRQLGQALGRQARGADGGCGQLRGIRRIVRQQDAGRQGGQRLLLQ
ncbi:hypothetical protein D3C71_1952600 [compost metagenome]